MSERRHLLCALGGLVAGVLLWPAGSAEAAPEAKQIVERADKIRNPAQRFRVRLRLVEYRNGQARQSATLMLYSKVHAETGRYRNLARFLEPAADVGKALLMDDQVLWFYDPASSSSVRISAQQRLVGQASNGDVMTVNFALDYTSRIAAEETINDADNKPRQTWRLELEAAGAQAVYRRIDYWVDKDSFQPVKARFFVDSGRALKLAFYRHYSRQLGEERPGEMIILDEVDTTVVTKIAFTDYAAADIAEHWFNRDYLPRLRDDGPGNER